MRANFESVMGKPPYGFEFGRWPEGHEWAGQYKAYTVQCAWDAWQEAAKFLKGETNEANTVSDSGPAGSGQDNTCGEPAASTSSTASLRS